MFLNKLYIYGGYVVIYLKLFCGMKNIPYTVYWKRHFMTFMKYIFHNLIYKRIKFL